MIAVYTPASGRMPDAIANAIANGSAIIPTVIPAKTSDVNFLTVYALSAVLIIGLNSGSRYIYWAFIL
jgi:hypothetical protein